MINLINEELMNITTEEKVNKNGEKYIEVLFKTGIETKNNKTKETKQHVITKLFAESEDYNSEKTGITINTSAYGTRVGLRSSNQKVKNDTNIYIIAIPFNGYVKPMFRTFDYRIYKSMVVTAEKRNITFHGAMYKKIAYLIVVPNEMMFDESHKYHKDVLELVMESFNLESISEDEKETIHATTTISFKASGEVIWEVVNEKVDPINPDDFKGQITFPLFRPGNKKDSSTRKHNDESREVPEHDNTHESLDDMIEKLNKQYTVEGHYDKDKKCRKKGKGKGKNRR